MRTSVLHWKEVLPVRCSIPLDPWDWNVSRHLVDFLVGGFNPFEKYQSKWESSPNRGENKKSLKPPRILYSSGNWKWSPTAYPILDPQQEIGSGDFWGIKSPQPQPLDKIMLLTSCSFQEGYIVVNGAITHNKWSYEWVIGVITPIHPIHYGKLTWQ